MGKLKETQVYGGSKAIVKTKSGKIYQVSIMMDDDVESPRESDEGNIGSMYCWHRHYNLGDFDECKAYEEPYDFIESLILSNESQRPDNGPSVYRYAMSTNGEGHTLSVKIVDGTEQWSLFDGNGTLCTTLDHPLDTSDASSFQFLKDVINELTAKQQIEYIKTLDVVILNLYLLDHSGLSISVKDFHDNWDSGQVGWIWVTKENVIKSLYTGYEDTSDWREKAEKALIAEVETYDEYLRGDVYGYVISQLSEELVDKSAKLEKYTEVDDDDFNDVESCWGFFGADGLKEIMACAEDIIDEPIVDVYVASCYN